jgi:hypothetical protein
MVVVLDGKSIYHSDFRICRKTRAEASSAPRQSAKIFHFQGGHIFQRKYRTKPADEIEGNIWLAGSDPKDLIFGVFFTTGDKILLNTLHIAKPAAATQFGQDAGLITKSYPLK